MNQEILQLAKAFENTTLSRRDAVNKFGTEGQKRHFEKHNKFKNKKVEDALIKTLNQLFESVESVKVKGVRAKQYKLGAAREEIATREDGRKNNGGAGQHRLYNNCPDRMERINKIIEGYTIKRFYLEYEQDDVIEDYEEWRVVDYLGIKDDYLISSLGRVFCISLGSLINIHYRSEKDKYLCVELYNYEGSLQTVLVHRLVATAFCKKEPNKNVVNHLNGYKDDNNYLNLEWTTPQENLRHAWETGLIKHVGRKPKSEDKKIDTQVQHELIKVLKELYPDDWESHLEVYNNRKYA